MKKLVLAAIALLLGTSVFAQETECIGKEMDGSLTLRVWGTGRNRTDALEQAKKQAIYDVIFNGITKGNTDYFMDRGEFLKYISMEDKRAGSTRVIKRNYRDVTVGVTVRVLVPQLRARLKSDGLL